METDLFGDAIVKKVNDRQGGNLVLGGIIPGMEQAPKPEKKSEGFAHALMFHDGRQICGDLIALTKDEVLWRRSDAGEPLHFPRSEVRRMVMVQVAAHGNFGQMIMMEASANPKEVPQPATLKLPGGDWLFGEVTSGDGETFAVKLGKGRAFTVPRTAIEWLCFAPVAVPAFGFSGDTTALEGWIGAGAEMKDGWLTLPGSGYLGRNIAAPERFEIAFEMPVSSKSSPTRLWLQPFGPEPNCYTTGTIELSFSAAEMERCIFIREFKRETTKFEGGGDRAKLRVLYDGPGKRLVVLRNGKPVGDWKLSGDKEEEALVQRVNQQERAKQRVIRRTHLSKRY